MTPPHHLEIKDLSLSRGGKRLLTGLNFELSSGEWLHLQGDNGVGKTSLLRMLCSLAPPDQGGVFWGKQNIQDDLPTYLRNIFFVGHKLALKEELSPVENLRVECALMDVHASESELTDAMAHFGLRGKEHVPLGILSQGQKRRVALAKLKLARAPLWILDEPLVALDAPTVVLFNQLVQTHVTAGGMVILTSHQAIEFGCAGRTLVLRS